MEIWSPKVRSWIFRGIGAILIGAIGSGVWQSLLAPAIHASSRWVLDITSLGLISYKNGIYQQIATDNPSAIDMAILSWVLTLCAMAFGFSSGMTISTLKIHQADPPSKERFRSALYVFLVFTIFVFINSLASQARLSYVNSADAHYHYVMRVASPYLDAGERAEIESNFAEIKSREDYVKVLSPLESICNAKGRPVTPFNPW
jgi:hypothetical protein